MFRCICCNVSLTDEELHEYKFDGTREDMCKKCRQVSHDDDILNEDWTVVLNDGLDEYEI